jgi:hypothetical protein
MIEQDLHDYMTADAGISALVGGKVYPVEMAEEPVYPVITYQKISGAREHTLDGAPTSATPRWQITSWGRTYAEAKALADAVEAAFDGKLGPPVPGSPIQGMFVLDAHDAFETVPQVFMCPVDVQLFYNPGGAPAVTPPAGTAPWRRYTLSSGLSGVIDGVNMVFTLPVFPSADTTQVVWNGSVVSAGDFSIVGNAIHLSFAPNVSDTLEVFAGGVL